MINLVAGMIFGTILAAGHLLSWNIEFTNDSGQALWRGCGLCVMASVVIFACAPLFGIWDPFVSDVLLHLRGSAWFPMLVLIGTAYMTARLILIYLTIHSFSDLPTGVYDDIDWLQYIPFFH